MTIPGFSVSELLLPINIYARYIWCITPDKIDDVMDVGLSIGIYGKNLFGR